MYDQYFQLDWKKNEIEKVKFAIFLVVWNNCYLLLTFLLWLSISFSFFNLYPIYSSISISLYLIYEGLLIYKYSILKIISLLHIYIAGNSWTSYFIFIVCPYFMQNLGKTLILFFKAINRLDSYEFFLLCIGIFNIAASFPFISTNSNIYNKNEHNKD